MAAEVLSERTECCFVVEHFLQSRVVSVTPRHVGIWVRFAHFGNFFRPGCAACRLFGGFTRFFFGVFISFGAQMSKTFGVGLRGGA